MGQQLAQVLNDRIDDLASDERPRSEIISEMGRAAGIEPGTVNQILDGSIDCPPRNRLNGFARALGLALSRLIDAAEEDGCDYGDEENSRPVVERRFYTAEIRLVESDGQRRIVGYAAVFSQLSEEMWGFREMIEQGAFQRTIAEGADVRALMNHDPNLILGRTRAGTLDLAEDDIGLRYEIAPPDTQYARDLMISLERGDINQSSFGFRVVKERWETRDEENIRFLMDVDLFDISPVTFPAYPQTSAEARAKAKALCASCGEGTAGAGGDPAHVGRLARLRRRLDFLERL